MNQNMHRAAPPRRGLAVLLCLILWLAACQPTTTAPTATPPPGDRATLQALAATPNPTPTADRRPPAATPAATLPPSSTTLARPATVAPAGATQSPSTSIALSPTPSGSSTLSTTTPPLTTQSLMANGDYAAAIAAAKATLAGTATPDEAKMARFHLGQALLFDGQNVAAGLELATFVQTYPNDALTAPAYFMLGRLFYGAQQWDAAADAYSRYVSLGGPLTDYAQNRVGNSHYSAQRYPEAIQAYTAATRLPNVSAPVLRAAWHGLGDAHKALGDTDAARAAYEAALQVAADNEDRAAAVYALYLLNAQVGDVEGARQALRRLWTQYPGTLGAYQAAQADADEGDVKLLYDKGLTAYQRGDLQMAVQAFNKNADEDPDHPAAVHLYAGHAYRRLGQARLAAFHYDQLIDTHPGDPLIPDALLGKARALRTSDPPTALATYDRLLDQYPTHAEAAQAAYEAARVVETSADCAQAIPRYKAVGDRFATAPGLDARGRLGLCQMETGDTAGATITWQALTSTALPERQAQGLFWLARLAEPTDPPRAALLYGQAQTAAPRSFYGTLATLALKTRPSRVIDDTASAEKWLLDTTQRSPDALAQAHQSVLADPDVLRAAAFVQQGQRDLAQRHLRLTRTRLGDDPLGLYWLTRQADALGQYTVSIGFAESLARQLDTPLANVPAAIQHLAFPTPYHDLVITASQKHRADAALLYAIMRQESRFEPGATSVAEARGLTQIVPATGQTIARALGVSNFTASDLYKPPVNIEFGAYFLAQQLARFDGQMWAALAGYNAGPNAVPRWIAAADDWARQIEAIDYPETTTYVRVVLENWAYYAGLQ